MTPTVVIVGSVAYLGTLNEETNRIEDCIQLRNAGTAICEDDMRALIKARNIGKAANVQMASKDAQYSSCPLSDEQVLLWDGLQSRMKLVKATALGKVENQQFDGAY